MMSLIRDLARSFREPHERLFVDREYRAIADRKGQVVVLLLAMVLITLLAVVLARSALTNLRQRMDDPFTTMLSIDAGGARLTPNYVRIRRFLQDCAANGRFGVDNASGNYTDLWPVYTNGDEGMQYALVSSFGFRTDHDLLQRVLADDNLLEDFSDHGIHHLSPEDFSGGLVVSRECVDMLGCAPEALRHRRIVVSVGGYTAALHVIAVVNTLPGRAQCLVEHNLLMDLKDPGRRNVFPYREYPNLRVWANAKTAELLPKITQEADRFFGEQVSIGVEEVPDLVAHSKLLVITRANGKVWDTGDLHHWQDRLTRFDSPFGPLNPAVDYGRVRFHVPDSADLFGSDVPAPYYRFDQLNITFSALDSIGAFQHALQVQTSRMDDGSRAHPVELDLSRVEAQKNFAMVAKLGSFLLAALVAFALLAIMLYLYNLLRGHLERMKMNLGTFMAFGVSPDLLRAGYLRAMLRLLLRVIGNALVLLLLFQLLLWGAGHSGVRLPGPLRHVTVLGNVWLYACILAILLSAMGICRWQLSRFLSIPPGDLIHDRK